MYTRAPLYFLTLVATIAFIVFPLTGRSDPLGERINAFKWVSDGIRALAGVLPSWVSQWLISYAQYPLTFLTLGGLILILLFSGRRVASAINDRMMTLWRESFAGTLAVPATTPSRVAAGRELLLVGLRSTWRYYLGPAFSAILIVYLAVTVGYRLIFTAVDEAGLVCQPTETLNYIPDAGALVAFEPSDMCFATGYKVGRLERYFLWTNPDPIALAKLHQGFSTTRATCKVDPALTLNNGSVVTDARGYSTFNNPEDTQLSWGATLRHILASPLRRYYFQPWFQPIARYAGQRSGFSRT